MHPYLEGWVDATPGDGVLGIELPPGCRAATVRLWEHGTRYALSLSSEVETGEHFSEAMLSWSNPTPLSIGFGYRVIPR